ncbi:hypothetical protein L1887_43311 [Cichorium endivia]|nr:hypothetical protein L1887_43311 [Cichorium endivia]
MGSDDTDHRLFIVRVRAVSRDGTFRLGAEGVGAREDRLVERLRARRNRLGEEKSSGAREALLRGDRSKQARRRANLKSGECGNAVRWGG